VEPVKELPGFNLEFNDLLEPTAARWVILATLQYFLSITAVNFYETFSETGSQSQQIREMRPARSARYWDQLESAHAANFSMSIV
jgi:hypothetical protein